MTAPSIAVLVGSLRKASLNRKLAHAMARMCAGKLNFDFVEIGHLPFYNDEHEPNPLPEWVSFREQVGRADGLLFVTPEYNRSVPAVLKNAIDVGSRPYGKSVFSRKPAAVISLSPGAMGGFGANHHLRQSLMCLDVPTMAGPEAYIGNGASLFDDNGDIVNPATKEFIGKFLDAFDHWVATNGIRR